MHSCIYLRNSHKYNVENKKILSQAHINRQYEFFKLGSKELNKYPTKHLSIITIDTTFMFRWTLNI
jgi:hypothetical protein